MSNPIIYKELQLTDRFIVAFPDGRIPNGFIDKTKTRLGITYTNFHDERHTITVIPSEAIIQDALDDYPHLGLFDVRAGITPKMIAEELASNKKIIRLVTTPESFGKIITAAKTLGKLQWLYDYFFLYMDEVHCYATEGFREYILTPFDNDHAWKFKNMAMGSATPFPFSDPRIKALQHYKITFAEKFGKINIVNDHNPKAVLHHMLTHPEMFPGNVHIFFNSVTASGDAIRTAGITDVSIYCRDDERNMVNLEEAIVYFKPQPIKGQYAKFNFYSCRYNDGWDLKDDETATIILVTDIGIPHSLIGIPYKGFQAVGRLKVPPHKIYHITNNYGKQGMKTFESIQQKWLYNADKHIKSYNQHIADCKRDGMEDSGLLKELVKPFAKFDYDVAKLNYTKTDQVICKEYCQEHYNCADTIEQTWQSVNYNTEVMSFDVEAVVRTKRSQEEINKQVIERFLHFKAHPTRYVYEVASATLKRYKTEFQLLFEALEVLGPEEIKRLNYNDKAMKAALIETSNRNMEAKLLRMLTDQIKINDKYTAPELKSILQGAYDALGIKKADGKAEKATARKFIDLGLFDLDKVKEKDDKGTRRVIYVVKRLKYQLRIAA